jgi:hypothetical protein
VGSRRRAPHCLVCGAIIKAIPTARCRQCEIRAGLAGGEVRRRAKVYGYDKHVVGRIVAEQDEPRSGEAAQMLREHLAWLQSNRPASTGRRGDVAGAGAAGNSSGARASDQSDDLRERQAAAWLRLAGRTSSTT